MPPKKRSRSCGPLLPSLSSIWRNACRPLTRGGRFAFKSAVSNLLDFLDTLDFRNVTDDADLTRLADEARALLTGVNMKDRKRPSKAV